MSDIPPTSSRLPTRRLRNARKADNFWADASPTASLSSHSNATANSSEGNRSSLGSMGVGELETDKTGATSARRAARRNKRDQNTSLEWHDEFNEGHNQEGNGGDARNVLNRPANAKANTAMGLAWSLFAPNSSVLHTLQTVSDRIHSDDESYLIPQSERDRRSAVHRWSEPTSPVTRPRRSTSDGALLVRSSPLTANQLSPLFAINKNAQFVASQILSGFNRVRTHHNRKELPKPSLQASFDASRSRRPHIELKTANASSTSRTGETRNGAGDTNTPEKVLERYREQVEQIFQHTGEPRNPKPKLTRGDHTWSSKFYHEYHLHLSQGIERALSHPGSFSVDCDTGIMNSPNNQPSGVCGVMKSYLYYQYNPGPEIFSRKVFAGGLPIDIEEDELSATFSRFGTLIVDWPNKNESNSHFPPKGYVFLIFEHEVSVRNLVRSCFVEEEKLFLYISSPLSPNKLVEIRPWRLADAEYVVDPNMTITARQAVFVGGVPRPIKAVELAHIMDHLYGSVACAGIDTDVKDNYPKGAGRVVFTNRNSYVKAISDQFIQLSHGEVEKTVELKPYVMDDQSCDECDGDRCGYRPASFFCPDLYCLQYYCEKCWETIHSSRSFEHHKPLIKEA